ncbi:MAG: dienelactone hydrolase family protein [Pseudomonadales bacterium]|nr:dienelactone hydrolase family protein [Pseudomonadales bacterium]
MSLEGFSLDQFSHDGETYPIYRRGTGPGVIIVHEVPGITPEVARFATIVADSGFTVLMPSLFGTPGKPNSNGYIAQQLLRACIRKEFKVLASRKSSPTTHYLRALCRSAHKKLGGPGVGAIGMCLTGNFALSLMVDPSVMAPVLSQPSLPFPVTTSKRSALHISDEDLACVKKRVTEKKQKILALRFSDDKTSPPERFDRLRKEFGDGIETIEIDSSPGNAHGISGKAHSVLTTEFVDEQGHPTLDAVNRTIEFLREKLICSTETEHGARLKG